MIDLTISSPAEPREPRLSPTTDRHPKKKRRTDDTPTILLDDNPNNTEDGESDDYDESVPPVVDLLNPDEKPKKLAGTACIICMEDEPVDLSVTPCGKSFCQKVWLLGDADITGFRSDKDTCSAISACLEL
jgi:hypothetical protein